MSTRNFLTINGPIRTYALSALANEPLSLSRLELSGMDNANQLMPCLVGEIDWSLIKTYGDMIGLRHADPTLKIYWLKLKKGGALRIELVCGTDVDYDSEPDFSYKLEFKCVGDEIKLSGPRLVTAKNPAP